MTIAKHDSLGDYPESIRYGQLLAGETLNSARASQTAAKGKQVLSRLGRTMRKD